MTIKAKLLVMAVLLALFGGTYYAGYLKGWYAHSDKVNSEHVAKSKKAEKAVATGEQKAAAARMIDAGAPASTKPRTAALSLVLLVAIITGLFSTIVFDFEIQVGQICQ